MLSASSVLVSAAKETDFLFERDDFCGGWGELISSWGAEAGNVVSCTAVTAALLELGADFLDFFAGFSDGEQIAVCSA